MTESVKLAVLRTVQPKKSLFIASNVQVFLNMSLTPFPIVGCKKPVLVPFHPMGRARGTIFHRLGEDVPEDLYFFLALLFLRRRFIDGKLLLC